jgi:hypothetical protein
MTTFFSLRRVLFPLAIYKESIQAPLPIILHLSNNFKEVGVLLLKPN